MFCVVEHMFSLSYYCLISFDAKLLLKNNDIYKIIVNKFLNQLIIN